MPPSIGSNIPINLVPKETDLPEQADLREDDAPPPAAAGSNAFDLKEAGHHLKEELSKGVQIGQRLMGQSPSLDDVEQGKAKLDLGDHGYAVEHVQRQLGVPVTGIYDPTTKAAAQQFQKENGLKPATGEIGQTTLHALDWKGSATLKDVEHGWKLHGATSKSGPMSESKGQAVIHVQKMLGIKQTGDFDAATQAAVKKFQETHGLHPATGEVGEQTMHAMEVAHSPSLSDLQQGKRKLELGDKGPAVDHVQQLLGMKPTGEFGPTTKAAVQRFQEAHGLHPATGEVGKQTLEALEAGSKFGSSRDLKLTPQQANSLIYAGSHDPSRLQSVPTDSAILKDAQKYLGTQYGWGCKNPEKDGKVDCSGFVDKVYADNHIQLPTGWTNDSSKDPSNNPSMCDNDYMKHVDPSQAKPGDVVIFGNKHIGIYVGDAPDQNGNKVPMYIGANHGDRSANSSGRVDIMPVSSYPGVTPQFYHPTPKALGA